MAVDSKISWCDNTWNWIWGCNPVSTACYSPCYAESLAKRAGRDFSQITRLSDTSFYAPLTWAKKMRAAGDTHRRRVFTLSLGDFFHPACDQWRDEIWRIIRATADCFDYLVLTKRPGRIGKCLPADWGEAGYSNVWLGATVEEQRWVDRRLTSLLSVPAAQYFVSAEPLTNLHIDQFGLEAGGYIDFGRYLYPDERGRHITWMITGGVSGPKWSPLDHDIPLAIRRQVLAAQGVGVQVALFEKQDAGRFPGTPLVLERRTYHQWPGELHPPTLTYQPTNERMQFAEAVV